MDSHGSHSPRPPIVVADAFKLHPVTLPELGRVVAAMNGSGSVGGDGLPLSVQLGAVCLS